MKTATTTFWADLNGRIECEQHIGNEATGRLQNRPTAQTITTSRTKWVRMTDQEASEFSELVGLDHSICESCRYTK